MEEQRERARTGTATAHGSEREHEQVIDFARGAGFRTRFVGYETTEVDTTVGALERTGGSGNGLVLTKFPESPFYAEGGGQVADSGVVESESGRGAGRGRLPARRRPGGRGRARRGRAPRGRAGSPRRRPARATRDRRQPHRHPPAARGPARAARHARAPGRLGGAAGQAALRLHARACALGRRTCGRSRTASTSGCWRAGR